MHSSKKPNAGTKNAVQNWVNSLSVNAQSEDKEQRDQSAGSGSHGVKMADGEDDLLLGAEAKSVLPVDFDLVNSITSASEKLADENCLTLPGMPGKTLTDDKDRKDISSNLEDQLRRWLSLSHQESFNSEASHASTTSLAQILEERRGDPEVILQNLGFSEAQSGLNCRIPDRFLQTPSMANGITVQKFLEGNPKLKDYLEEKSAIQNPFEMMITSPQEHCLACKESRTSSGSFFQAALAVTMVNRFKKLIEKSGSVQKPTLIAEAVLCMTPTGCKYWSVLPNKNRDFLERNGYYDIIWSTVDAAHEMTDQISFSRTPGAGAKDGVTRDSMRSETSNLPDGEVVRDDTTEVRSQCHHGRNNTKIPGRFLSSPSIVPSHLIIFEEAVLDKPEEQSAPEECSPAVHEDVAVDVHEGPSSEPHKSEVDLLRPYAVDSLKLEPESGGTTDPLSYKGFSSLTEVSASSVAEDSDVLLPLVVPLPQVVSLPQTVTNSNVKNESLVSSDFLLLFTAIGVTEEGDYMRQNDSLDIVSLPKGDQESRQIDSIAVEKISAVNPKFNTVSRDHHFMEKTATRIKRISFANCRSHSLDIDSLDIEDTYNGKEAITPISNPRSHLKDKLREQFSIQSDSSGFADGDQMDVSISSAAESNKMLVNLANGIKEVSCSNCGHSIPLSASVLLEHLDSNPLGQPCSESSGEDYIQFLPRTKPGISNCSVFTQTDVTWTSHCNAFEQFPKSDTANITEYSNLNELLDGQAKAIDFQLRGGAIVHMPENSISQISPGHLLSSGSDSFYHQRQLSCSSTQSPRSFQELEASEHMLRTPENDEVQFSSNGVSLSTKFDKKGCGNVGHYARSVPLRLNLNSASSAEVQSQVTTDALTRRNADAFGAYRDYPALHYSKLDPSENAVDYPNVQKSLTLRSDYLMVDDGDSLQRDITTSSKRLPSLARTQQQFHFNSDEEKKGNYDIQKNSEECFPNAADHWLLYDQLQSLPFVHVPDFAFILQRGSCSPQAFSVYSDWTEHFKEEIKLVECALQAFKFQNRLLLLRMCKISSPDGLPPSDRRELDEMKNLQDEVGSELEEMEEYLMERLKRIFQLQHQLHDSFSVRDLASSTIVQSMCKLLHEQMYQSGIVNSMYAAAAAAESDGQPQQLAESPCDASPSTPIYCLSSPSTPIYCLSSPHPWVTSSAPLLQLTESLTSLERVLGGLQRSTEALQKNSTFQQPVSTQTKEAKKRKSYQRFLPACLKPQLPKN